MKSVERMAQELIDVGSGQRTLEVHRAMCLALATHIGGLHQVGGLSLSDALACLDEARDQIAAQMTADFGTYSCAALN